MIGKILNETFGKAYIKNIKTSIDRRRFIEDSCKKIQLEYEIFEAYEGSKFLDENYTFTHVQGNIIRYPASVGFWGNDESTRHILMKEINNDTDSFIMLDDDSYFYNYEKSESILKTIQTKLPEDWDIIILGGMQELYSYGNYQYNILDAWESASGCHGVAVHNRVYKKFFEILQEGKFKGDGIVIHLHNIGKKIYRIYPDICAQNRKLFSDINKVYHE